MENQTQVHALYTGNSPLLKGKTALVNFHSDFVTAQFDDVNTGYSYGWHVFAKDDFAVLGDAPQAEGGGASEIVATENLPDKASWDVLERINAIKEGAEALVHGVTKQFAAIGQAKETYEEAPGLAIQPSPSDQRPVPQDDRPEWEKPLLLPPPRSPAEEMAIIMSNLDKRLKLVLPILVEIRDLGRMFAWGIIAVAGVGALWLLFLALRS